jgi:hypothetical protein
MKLIKNIFGFFKRSVDELAPYTVYNYELKAAHPCWSLKEVFEWLACYDEEQFGHTAVLDFNGEVIN